MRKGRIACVVALLFLNSAAVAQVNTPKEIADTIIRLCIAGGSTQAMLVGRDILVLLRDDKGSLKGDIKISDLDMIGGVAESITEASHQVAADQAHRVDDCLDPLWDKLCHFVCMSGKLPLDEALEKLIAGNVAFNNPEHMTVGRPRLVEAKLSTTLPPDELKAQLTEAGRIESAELTVGDRMSATLNGGAEFDISPSGPQVQWISEQQVTTWTWNVTPKMAGTQYLTLSFDAVITLSGKDANRNIRTLARQIEVDVGWPTTPSEWFDLSRKWFDTVNWLWASIIPIGLVLVGWWRRFVRHQKGTPNPDT